MRKKAPSMATITTVAIKYLFPYQNVSNTFRNALKSYIENCYQEFGCVSLYITKSTELTQSFREFMSNFPELDCGKRQVTIFQNLSVGYRKQYTDDRCIKVLPVEV